ncbi:putative sodium bile acid cotransporter [Rosa chinensis]|uniref:Putative sodium bile acid cotransporter n=1 Tax=Rosa chinensis TaxID=74649 RepID=A0A2P6SBU8_ROSCH|nr:putative sodium bile acid cotransporter [Rosa chinensis]
MCFCYGQNVCGLLCAALVGGVTLGFAYPSLGCLADSYSLSKFSTFGIFIISGLTLHTGKIIAAADAWPVGIFGLVIRIVVRFKGFC